MLAGRVGAIEANQSRRHRYAYAPRSYLVEPERFGHYEEVEWREDTDPDESDRLLASQWQHLVCFLAREAAADARLTLDQVAEQTRMGRENFWRLIRGVGPMKLEDFAALHRILNIYFMQISSEHPKRVGK